MIDERLDDILREFRESELEGAPKRHYLQTDACPSLDKLGNGLRNALRGWADAEKGHFAGCDFCQKTAGFLWKAEPPSVLALVSFAADPAGCPFGAAMQRYLKEDDSWLVRLALSAGALIRMIERYRQSPSSEVGSQSMVLGFGQALAAEANFNPEPRQRLHFRSSSPDGSLISLLEETDEGLLVVHVETRSAEDHGRIVSIEILSPGAPLKAKILLEKRRAQRGGCHGKHVFGDYSQFEYLQARRVIVASWADEEDNSGQG